jgi:Flp pilus assembly protein CpaB
MTTRVLRGVAVALALLVAALAFFGARLDTGGGDPYAQTPVLVANRTIQAGTPGTIVVDRVMYTESMLPREEVFEGAIADPAFLTGRAAAVEIVPGHQLTAPDFAATTTTTIDSQITGRQRALSISMDTIHGSLGQLKAGDDVDIDMRTIRESTGEPQISAMSSRCSPCQAPRARPSSSVRIRGTLRSSPTPPTTSGSGSSFGRPPASRGTSQR